MRNFLYLLIMDPVAVATKTYAEYERHEPGFGRPFIEAYLAAFQAAKTGRMSHLLIKSIHAAATRHLPGAQSGRYKTESGRFIIYGQRSDRGRNTRYSATRQGIIDFIQYWMIQNPKPVHSLSFENEKTASGVVLHHNHKHDALIWTVSVAGKRSDEFFNLEKKLPQIDDLCRKFDFTCHINTMITNVEAQKIQAIVARKMEAIFDEYHAEVSAAASDDEKITIITKHVQRIEQLHPFADGNIRTCVILLNKLLHDHNIPLSLLLNPNKLDACDLSELVRMVKEGQRIFAELLAHEDPSEFIIHTAEDMPELQHIRCLPHDLGYPELLEPLLTLFVSPELVVVASAARDSFFFDANAVIKDQLFRILRTSLDKNQSGKCDIIRQAIQEAKYGVALRNACVFSELEIVHDLLCCSADLGLDVNEASSNGKTALDWLPVTHTETAELLGTYGARTGKRVTKP